MVFGKKVVYNENTEKYFLDEINKLKAEIEKMKQEPKDTTAPAKQVDFSLVEAARDNLVEFFRQLKDE